MKRKCTHPKNPNSYAGANAASTEFANNKPTLSRARFKFCSDIECVHYINGKCLVDGTLNERECIQSAITFFKWLKKNKYQIIKKG